MTQCNKTRGEKKQEETIWKEKGRLKEKSQNSMNVKRLRVDKRPMARSGTERARR
jgi:hypothetical protein